MKQQKFATHELKAKKRQVSIEEEKMIKNSFKLNTLTQFKLYYLIS